MLLIQYTGMLKGLFRILAHATYSTYMNVKGIVKNISPSYLFTGLGIRSSVFWVNRLFFAKKWATWAICSYCSFMVSDLSDSLTSLIKKKEMGRIAFLKKLTKHVPKNTILVKFFWANRSFFVSKRANEQFAQKNECFAHLLIYHERPERIALSRY